MDPFITVPSSVHPRNGFSVLDEFSASNRRLIAPLTFDLSFKKTQAIFKRDPEEILSPHAAIALDEGGFARHAWRGKRFAGFLGFAINNFEDSGIPRVAAFTRGAVVLHVPDVSLDDERKTVYAVAPDKFSLVGDDEDVVVGAVIRVDLSGTLPRAVVAFRSFNDPREFDFDRGFVRPVMRERAR